MLNQALAHARVPRLTFILRKAYGLAYFSMSGGRMGSTFMCGWPTAEISFMDPEVAVNVVHAPQLAQVEDEVARKVEAVRLADELRRETSVYAAAAVMGVDEVVDPADTPLVMAEALDRLMAAYDPKNRERILSTWPTCF
jgi:acetyl-CoA carboxylase carboxyltransferase component